MVISKKTLACFVVALAMFLHGCASTADKPLSRKDLQSLVQVRVARFQSPGYMKNTTGAKVTSAVVAVPFMLFGAVGGAVGGGLYASVKNRMMVSAGKEMQSKYGLPDFSELVYKRFSDRLLDDHPNGPEFLIEDAPLTETPSDTSSCILTINAVAIVSNDTGLETHTEGLLLDPAQTVLWKKAVHYKSSDRNRPCKMSELEADNARLLQEEIAYAVDKTAAELIDHFENGTEAVKPEQVPFRQGE